MVEDEPLPTPVFAAWTCMAEIDSPIGEACTSVHVEPLVQGIEAACSMNASTCASERKWMNGSCTGVRGHDSYGSRRG